MIIRKKLLCAFLAVILVFTMTAVIPAAATDSSPAPLSAAGDVAAVATQSMSGNFNGCTLTGDGSTDMVNIALAQNERNQPSMGYTEGWCADFVSDCAKIAGQATAIPFRGAVNDLYNSVLSAGGTRVSSAVAGDLVFFSNGSGYGHVGIALDGSRNVSGNIFYMGASPSKVCVLKNSSEGYSSWVYVRPNYSNSSAPHVHNYTEYVYYWDAHPHYKCYRCSCGEVKENTSQPTYIDSCRDCYPVGKSTVSAKYDVFYTDEEISFSWTEAQYATHYNLWIYRKASDGSYSNLVERNDLIKTTSYTTRGLEPGDYKTVFHSYDSTRWEHDNSDWSHCRADDVYFSVISDTTSGGVKTIYFRNEKGFNPVYAYVWTNETYKTAWPGDKMTYEGKDENGNQVYSIDVDTTKYRNIIFSGGSNATQTEDIRLRPEFNSYYCTSLGTDSKYQAEGYQYISADTAPSKTVEKNGHKYEYYYYPTTWSKAYRVCEQKGGHLVTITSAEENSLVYELANSFPSILCWLGGTDELAEGTWAWITGESFSFSNWGTGEPNNNNDKENQLMMFINSGDELNGKWNDSDGLSQTTSNSFNCFICEYDDDVNENDYFPVDSFTNRNNFYEVYNDSVTWQTAKRICEKKGGHLVCIGDKTEDDLIQSAIGENAIPYYWLGASDIDEEGNWAWVTGEPFSYSYWSTDEPNNHRGNENCLQMISSTGKWNDDESYSSEYTAIGFICEYEKNVKDINIITKGGEDNIAVAWTAVPNAGRYEFIAEYASGQTDCIATPATTAEWAPDIYNTAPVNIRIRAYDLAGNIIGESKKYQYSISCALADWWGRCGDADLDDNINVKDATLIQKYLAQLVEFSKIQIIAANVDDDPNTNIKDATTIQKHIAKIAVVNHIGEERFRGFPIYSITRC